MQLYTLKNDNTVEVTAKNYKLKWGEHALKENNSRNNVKWENMVK